MAPSTWTGLLGGLVRVLWDLFLPGDVALTDSGFCSYADVFLPYSPIRQHADPAATDSFNDAADPVH